MATLVFTSKHSVLAGTLTVTVNYSVSQGGDSYTLTVQSIVAKANSSRAWHNVHPSSSTLGYDGTKATIAANSSKTWTVSKSKVVQKTHSAQSVPVYFAIGSKESGDTYETGAYATLTLSVPAKTTYKVTLDANGGTGGTASLTKWHGETLSLTAGFTAPTRTGYRFIGWGTSSSATTTIATYTDDVATTLYAVWEKLITGITLDVTTLRVTDGISTAEDDEGTWCYGTCAYSITGPAAADVTFTVSVTPSTPQIIQDTFTATKTEDNTLTGSFVFRASGCATDASYTFMIEAVAENTSATQTVTKSQGNVLSMAYYVLDVLGDNYVSSGQRPAHGISFGAPCKTEGFHVAMPADFSSGLDVTGEIACDTDTSWTTLNGTIKYRIHHGVCYVCGDSVSGGTSVGTSGTTVGTLPTGARPSITVNGAASTKSNAANGQFSIDSSGVITVWNLSTSSPYWCFTAAFPVG